MQSHYRTSLHQRDEDDYEQDYYDEYEEDDSEEEEEAEDEKKEPVLSKEEQTFLSLREQIKEQIRQKNKKQSAPADKRKATSNAPADKGKATSNDGFGSFFGPSKPVIASRVLDESRAIRETKHIVSRIASSSAGNAKSTCSATSEKKAPVQYQQPKVINEVKKKAQTLKDTRDYSFLLSDDADFPATDKEEQRQQPAIRKPVPNSDGPSVQASSKFKQSMGKPVRPESRGHESKHSTLKNPQPQARVGAAKGVGTARPKPASDEPRRVGSNATNGTGRPIGQKPLPSKVSAMTMTTDRPPAKVMNDPSLKKRIPSTVPQSSTPKNHQLEQKRPSERLDKARPVPKPQLSSSGSKQQLPSSALKRQLPSSAPKRQLPSSAPKRQLPSSAPKRQLPSSAPKQQLPSSAPKQLLPSSKPQMKPSQQILLRDDRLKKKPMKRKFDEEDEDAIQMIRNMFGYNPNRYVGVDEDVSDMEADFSTIQMEERRSSKIAMKEDEEQLLLIEEEERRERMRKKQKLNRR